MTFRIMQWVALLAVCSLVLSACRGDDAADDTTTPRPETSTTAPGPAPGETTATTAMPLTELLVWADPLRAEVVEQAAPAFTEKTGVTVDVELVDQGEIRDRLGVAGPAGEGPDVFIGASDWIGDLASNGVLEPLEPGAWSSDFIDSALAAVSYEGTLYGVPYTAQAVAMYYNADLVAEAPAAFDELIAACETDAVEACLGVPDDAYHNYPFISATGGYVFGESNGVYDATDVGLDGEGAIEGARLIEDMTDRGLLVATSYEETRSSFLAGEQPFWITGPWELGAVADAAFTWSVAKVPAINGGTPRPFIDVQAFFLSSFSLNKQAAQSFLFDVIAGQDVQAALFAADGRPPVHGPVVEQAFDDAALSAFVASAADGVPIPNIPEMRHVWGPLGRNLELVRSGEVDASSAMRMAAESVRAAIEG